MVAFAGEHCHPSFYSTGHGAFLTGRSAAQFFIHAASQREQQDEEEVIKSMIFSFLIGLI